MTLRRQAPLWLALLMLSTLAACKTSRRDESLDRESAYNDLKQENSQLRSRLDQLNSQLEALTAASGAEGAEGDALRTRIGQLQEEIQGLQRQLRERPTLTREVKVEVPAKPSGPAGLTVNTLSSGDVLLTLDSAVTFNTGEHRLQGSGQQLLRNEVAAEIRANPSTIISIEGHTDDQVMKNGAEIYGNNLGLSLARAMEVRTYLVEKVQIDEKRIRVVGYGQHRPRIPNRDEASRQENRRVEIVLLKDRG